MGHRIVELSTSRSIPASQNAGGSRGSLAHVKLHRDVERCTLASRAESFENRARNKRGALREESQQATLGDGN